MNKIFLAFLIIILNSGCAMGPVDFSNFNKNTSVEEYFEAVAKRIDDKYGAFVVDSDIDGQYKLNIPPRYESELYGLSISQWQRLSMIEDLKEVCSLNYSNSGKAKLYGENERLPITSPIYELLNIDRKLLTLVNTNSIGAAPQDALNKYSNDVITGSMYEYTNISPYYQVNFPYLTCASKTSKGLNYHFGVYFIVYKKDLANYPRHWVYIDKNLETINSVISDATEKEINKTLMELRTKVSKAKNNVHLYSGKGEVNGSLIEVELVPEKYTKEKYILTGSLVNRSKKPYHLNVNDIGDIVDEKGNSFGTMGEYVDSRLKISTKNCSIYGEKSETVLVNPNQSCNFILPLKIPGLPEMVEKLQINLLGSTIELNPISEYDKICGSGCSPSI